jgi:hypothetical protein
MVTQRLFCRTHGSSGIVKLIQPLFFACRVQPNQLPIEDLHIDFNERLWTLTQRIFQKDGWYQQDKTIEGAAFQYERSETDIHDAGMVNTGRYARKKDVMGKMKRK